MSSSSVPALRAAREVEGDEAAGGVAEDDRLLDADEPAERANVVGHLLERARLGWRGRGSPLAAQVEEDELAVVGERREAGPQVALVEAGAAVERDQRRSAP